MRERERESIKRDSEHRNHLYLIAEDKLKQKTVNLVFCNTLGAKLSSNIPTQL
jgi:hypothetical protein